MHDLLARVKAHVDALPDAERGPLLYALDTPGRVSGVIRGDVVEFTAWDENGAHLFLTLELDA